MGPWNSKETTNSLMKDYTVIQRNAVDNLTMLRHKSTEEEFLLREFNLNDKRESDKVMEKLADLKNKLGGCKHVVPLHDYLMNSEDQYCSTFYKIYALFQYPQRTLDDQINDRNLQKRRFSETELWSILASCILGLCHLQKNGIKHSALKSTNILLSQEGIIKISDPFANGSTTNYQTALTKRNTPHLYLSPQQTVSLQQEIVSPSINNYKSDIWSLGMIMLETGLLEYQDDCYRDDWSRIQWETVQYNIDRFGKAYSEEIKNMIEFMLSRDQRGRPDWVELQEYVMKSGEEGKKSFIQDDNHKFSQSVINTNDFANRNSMASRPSVVNQPSTIPLSTSNQVNLLSSRKQQSNVFPSSYHQPYPEPKQVIQVQHQSPRETSSFGFRPSIVTNPHPPQYSSYNSPPHLPHIPHLPPPSSNSHGQALNPNKPSIIETTRPTRNIFPTNNYFIKTKIDQNLIMVDEDEESDRQSNRGPYQKQNNLEYRPTNIIQSNLTHGPPRYSSALSNQSNSPSSNQYQIDANHNLKYVEEIFKMGSRYEGYKLNGKRHGHGKFYYQDGGMYDGEWKQNKMQGYGKLFYQSGKLAYDGNWISDQFSGKGVLYNEVPDLLTHPFNYQNFDDVDQFWTKYEGQFSDDMKNGRGTLFLSNGQRFEGEFISDIVEGYGVFFCENGKTVSGRWIGNQKNS